MKSFQEHYPEHLAHCYGCGRLNEHGLRLATYWEGEGSVTRFTPQPFHCAVAGVVYGGLLASLVDCHSTGTAAAARYRAEGRDMDTLPAFRFVTGSLEVTYLKPTPLGPSIEVHGRVSEIRGRRVRVESNVVVEGVETARGVVVAIQMPEEFGAS